MNATGPFFSSQRLREQASDYRRLAQRLLENADNLERQARQQAKIEKRMRDKALEALVLRLLKLHDGNVVAAVRILRAEGHRVSLPTIYKIGKAHDITFRSGLADEHKPAILALLKQHKAKDVHRILTANSGPLAEQRQQAELPAEPLAITYLTVTKIGRQNQFL